MPYYIRLLRPPALQLLPDCGSQSGKHGSKKTSKKPLSAPKTRPRSKNESANTIYPHTLRLTLAITTDLGDSFYDLPLSSSNLSLHVDLYDSLREPDTYWDSADSLGKGAVLVSTADRSLDHNSHENVSLDKHPTRQRKLATGTLTWQRGTRVLACHVPLQSCEGHPDDLIKALQESQTKADRAEDGLWVHVSAAPASPASENPHCMLETRLRAEARGGLDVLLSQCMPEIVSVWAQVNFDNWGGTNVEKRVLRRFGVPVDGIGVRELRVWEEMGESIARHVWDAALACLTILSPPSSLPMPSDSDTLSLPIQSLLYDLFRPSRPSELQILELGAGCGVVGLSIAQFLSRKNITSRVILTDLPEAMDVLTANIGNLASGLAQEVSVESRVLEWSWAQGASEAERNGGHQGVPQELRDLAPNLILVSDCTYNVSSFENLIAMIRWATVRGQESRRDERGEEKKLDVLVALKRRHDSEAVFFRMMYEAGFEAVASAEIPLPDRGKIDMGLKVERVEIWGFIWRRP